MKKNNLDEMQLQKRNKIGNQAFMLLFYLLMIDMGLYGFGFRWLQYPTNVFVIMLVCMGYYLIRIIWSNAYVGPQTKEIGVGKAAVFTIAVAVLAAAAAIFISKSNLIKVPAAESNDNGALILFIISTVSLVIAFVVSIISKKQNRSDDE